MLISLPELQASAWDGPPRKESEIQDTDGGHWLTRAWANVVQPQALLERVSLHVHVPMRFRLSTPLMDSNISRICSTVMVTPCSATHHHMHGRCELYVPLPHPSYLCWSRCSIGHTRCLHETGIRLMWFNKSNMHVHAQAISPTLQTAVAALGTDLLFLHWLVTVICVQCRCIRERLFFTRYLLCAI